MQRHNNGFTLIEIIVVIAIIAILSLIIFPMVSGFTSDAKQTVANANAKECYKIAMLKKADIDYSLYDEELEIYDGCIIKNSKGNYRVENEYDGNVEIDEVYWFSDKDNWKYTNKNNVAISNFNEIIILEPTYGTYTVK